MEMKKKRIVYSLTGRGLFSELSNLALALVYADYNQEELTVNTRNWNARCHALTTEEKSAMQNPGY